MLSADAGFRVEALPAAEMCRQRPNSRLGHEATSGPRVANLPVKLGTRPIGDVRRSRFVAAKQTVAVRRCEPAGGLMAAASALRSFQLAHRILLGAGILDVDRF